MTLIWQVWEPNPSQLLVKSSICHFALWECIWKTVYLLLSCAVDCPPSEFLSVFGIALTPNALPVFNWQNLHQHTNLDRHDIKLHHKPKHPIWVHSATPMYALYTIWPCTIHCVPKLDLGLAPRAHAHTLIGIFIHPLSNSLGREPYHSKTTEEQSHHKYLGPILVPCLCVCVCVV